ncbi:nuclear transport factor 2 family protein [Nocardia caishijiensis]|uniref:SnoaL-like protein n=1 Tax=Nocardia caishijiensis TaxID=184756 RepID=A0ABQ6YF70_9NOCA|nr:nuclear transport factor 2 family protein [Nocardia caishijiensis]KAF0835788.1 SnoaL-like protein [Nocardia caishijiensis]
MNNVVAQYLEAWNTREPGARRSAVARLFTPQVGYVDPMVAVNGHAELEAAIAGVQTQFPDWTFRLAGPVDAHHDQVRFTWGLGPADGDAVVIGFDVAVLVDGRIDRVYGFLDHVPAAA